MNQRHLLPIKDDSKSYKTMVDITRAFDDPDIDMRFMFGEFIVSLIMAEWTSHGTDKELNPEMWQHDEYHSQLNDALVRWVEKKGWDVDTEEGFDNYQMYQESLENELSTLYCQMVDEYRTVILELKNLLHENYAWFVSGIVGDTLILESSELTEESL